MDAAACRAPSLDDDEDVFLSCDDDEDDDGGDVTEAAAQGGGAASGSGLDSSTTTTAAPDGGQSGGDAHREGTVGPPAPAAAPSSRTGASPPLNAPPSVPRCVADVAREPAEEGRLITEGLAKPGQGSEVTTRSTPSEASTQDVSAIDLSTQDVSTGELVPDTPSCVSTHDTPSSVSTQDTPSCVSTHDTPSSVSTHDTPSSVSTQDTPSCVSTHDTPSSVSTHDTPSSVSTQDTPSSVSTQDKPSSVSTQDTPSNISTQDKPLCVSIQDNPLCVLIQDTSSNVSTQDTPSSVSTQDTSSSVSTQDKPSNVSTQDTPSSVSTQDTPSNISTQDKPLCVSIQDNPLCVLIQDTSSNVSTQDTPSSVSTQETSSSVSTQDKPSNVSTQDTPSSVSTQDKPLCVSIQDTSSNVSTQEISSCATVLCSPFVVSSQDTPSEVLIQDTPPEVSSHDTPPEVSPHDTPPEVSPHNTPPEVSPHNTPPEVSPHDTPSEVSPHDTPSEVSPHNTPPEVSPHNTPPEVSSHDTPPEVSSHDTPPEVSSYDTPPEVSSHDTPPEVSSHDTPPEVSSHDTPPEVSSHDTSPEVSSHDTPPEVSSHITPPEVSSHITPPEVSPHDTPSEVSPHNTPPEVSSHDTSPEVSSHDTPLKVSVLDTHTEVFTKDLPSSLTTKDASDLITKDAPSQLTTKVTPSDYQDTEVMKNVVGEEINSGSVCDDKLMQDDDIKNVTCSVSQDVDMKKNVVEGEIISETGCDESVGAEWTYTTNETEVEALVASPENDDGVASECVEIVDCEVSTGLLGDTVESDHAVSLNFQQNAETTQIRDLKIIENVSKLEKKTVNEHDVCGEDLKVGLKDLDKVGNTINIYEMKNFCDEIVNDVEKIKDAKNVDNVIISDSENVSKDFVEKSDIETVNENEDYFVNDLADFCEKIVTEKEIDEDVIIDIQDSNDDEDIDNLNNFVEDVVADSVMSDNEWDSCAEDISDDRRVNGGYLDGRERHSRIQTAALYDVPEEADGESSLSELGIGSAGYQLGSIKLATDLSSEIFRKGHLPAAESASVVSDSQTATDSEDDKWSVDSLCVDDKVNLSDSLGETSCDLTFRLDDSLDYGESVGRGSLDGGVSVDTDSGYMRSISLMDSLNSLPFSDTDEYSSFPSQSPNFSFNLHYWDKLQTPHLNNFTHPSNKLQPLHFNNNPLLSELETPKTATVEVGLDLRNEDFIFPLELDKTPTPKVDNVSYGQLFCASQGSHLTNSSSDHNCAKTRRLAFHEVDSLDEEDHKTIQTGITQNRQDVRRTDPAQAKLRSSISWLLSKVYGSNVPKELQDPFYQTAEGQTVLRPVMVNYMSSSELYCQACCNLFPETHTQWKGHWSIIQVLSRKGIYISDETSVTETVLVQTAPIRLKAHLALIDAIMRAYINEVASVEKVVIAVKRLTTFSASSELPTTSEEALTFWINKICTILRNPEGEDSTAGGAETGHKGRAVSKPAAQRDPVYVPLLEDLMRDIGDGCSVAAVIAYYRPHLLNIQDLCLKDSIGIADSLYNLRQIAEFCRNHLPWKSFHLTYEDLLYTHESMKINIITFLADLFYCFEGPGRPGAETHSPSAALMAAKEKLDAMPAAGKKSSVSTVTSVPISAATKKSFQRMQFDDTASNLGITRSSVISPTSHQPLLPRRSGGRRAVPQDDGQSSSPPTSRRGRRTLSLSSPQDRDTIHKSVLAWQDDQKITSRSHSQGRNNLLTDVSIDSSLNQSTNAENLSLDLSELDHLDTPRAKGGTGLDPSHPDYMELESVTSGQPSRFATPQQAVTDRSTSRTPTALGSDHRLEPLTPAVLKPTKERDISLSKAEERGDRSHRRKQVSSPSLRPSSQQSSHHSARSSSEDLNVSVSSSSEETTVSSLPSGESQSPRMTAAHQLASKPYEAFTIGPDLSQQSESSPLNSARSNAISTAGSYTVDNRVTAQAARAAGIPIVADSADMNHNIVDVNRSREGSVASSGEYSDHESQKIHQDHKVRESGPATIPSSNVNNNSTAKPAIVVVTTDKLGRMDSAEEGKMYIKMSPSQTTNFAELKRLKDKLGYKIDKVDNSALIYMQSGTQGGPYDKLNTGQGLKTTFGNQLAQDQPGIAKPDHHGLTSPSPVPDNVSAESNGSAEPGSSELQQLRLKLEQKRKEIERKKHRQEAQQNKIRQRLGKAAFMRVVSKHLDGGEEESESLAEEGASDQPDMPALSTQAQLQARLGHPVPRLPLGAMARGQPVVQGHPLQSLKPQGSVIPPDTSAQRFTDWTNVSKVSQQTLTKTELPQQPLMANSCPGDLGADQRTPPSKSANSRAFSREGIQQTIDNVKNKWFKSSSDLVSGGQGSEDEVDTYRVHGQDLVVGARREQSQSSQVGGSSTPVPIPPSSLSAQARDTSSPRQNVGDAEYQEYDSSLDKLNNSLTELQGEIMRLSLQHEQLKAAQTPVSGQPVGFDPRLSDALEAIGSTAAGTVPSARPIHGIPQQAPYVHAAMVRKQQQMDTSGGSSMSTSQASSNSTGDSGDPQQGPGTSQDQTSGLADGATDGFFIAFADSTPKRPKPKLSTDQQQGATPSTHAKTPVHFDSAVAVTPQKIDEPLEEASPNVGFIIKDETAMTKEQVYEDEMQKKRVKLMEMQKKRKEEQEKRKMEKEAEMAKKMEEKMMKEEEMERKKAEEKARREVIFQQYLQKKQEEEEQTPASKPRIKKRDSSSGGKPRPKSMFVKSKAATPEPGAMGGFDSGSSSQEDLTGRNNGGRSTPGVMSAMRSTYHFRLPPPSSGIRKAVSCNTLQGSPNGAQGPATYRRPPSPDLYKIKQQRQRGNSQDSGSETGSGSNPGSDYAGPKLFVKPSAKSNRHIIVNAISHCCLAGSVNTDMKNKVLEELSKCDANHFLILFRDAGCQYRGLFIFYPETEEAFKIHGVGPKHITNKMCEKFYKYNSGAKSFMEITSTKHLSVSVDAVVLQGTVWKTGKAVVKR